MLCWMRVAPSLDHGVNLPASLVRTLYGAALHTPSSRYSRFNIAMFADPVHPEAAPEVATATQ